MVSEEKSSVVLIFLSHRQGFLVPSGFFQCFLFVFDFLWFEYMTQCRFVCVWYLSFLVFSELSGSSLVSVNDWKILSHYYFTYFFCSFLLLLVFPLHVCYTFCNCSCFWIFFFFLQSFFSLTFSLGKFQFWWQMFWTSSFCP